MDNLTKLRYWTFKILPLVYDDSLSYYEVLTKVTAKINELIDSNNSMPQAITTEVKKQLSSDELATQIMNGLVHAIATDEGTKTFTTNAKSGGELIFLDGTLYKVTAVMPAGTNYIVDTNITTVNIYEELKTIKETYISSNNEHWNERSINNYDTGVYLYWKDELYITIKNIKINDILYANGDNQNLKQITLSSEITDHYNEMHNADTNLQNQININDADIKKLQNKDTEIEGRLNGIVAQAGTDNTEILDARKEAMVLGGSTKATLYESITDQIQKIFNITVKSPYNCIYIASLKDYTTDGSDDANKLYESYMFQTLHLKSKNLPVDELNGFFLSLHGTGHEYGTIQMIFDSNGTLMFVRASYDTSGEWIDWKEYPYASPSSYLNVLNSVTTNSTNDFDYLTRAINFGCVNLTASNSPVTTPIDGFIKVEKFTNNQSYGITQKIYDANGTLLYNRSKYIYDAKWGKWNNAQTINIPTSYNWCSGFNKVTIVGDSISAGLMYLGEQGKFKLNWDMAWSKHTFPNAERYNCAQSGATAKSFFTQQECIDKLNAVTDNGLIIIYLGTNTMKNESGEAYSDGNENDIVTSYNDMPTDTIVGWTSKLVKTLQHKAPNAIILLCDLPQYNQYEKWQNINDIVAKGCNCEHLITHPYISDYYVLENNNDGNHFSQIGYVSVGKMFEKAINNFIENNSAIFAKI